LAAAAVPVVVGTATGWWLRSPSAHRWWVAAAPLSRLAPPDPSWHFFLGVVNGPGTVIWWRAVCALVVALAVQIGTNYANDYSDGVRGTDHARVGPLRLVGSGLVAPVVVRRAALLSFALAAVAGIALAAATTWWLVPIGAACFVAGWLYTGGPRPYGYLGLGEVFVFAFFGVVATVGSSYVQFPHLFTGAAGAPFAARYDLLVPLWASVVVGLLATALLEANNLRDITSDRASGKRTLAVRLGRRRAGWLYAGSLAGVAAGVAAVAVVRPWALLALLAAPLCVGPVRAALGPAEGRALLPVLGGTGRLQLVVGVLLAVGILL
jgi:1,4-dihydroxy-2-naphthoate octaprenyltransferase